MARLSAAILCDFAQVRENVLFVSSGTISRVRADATPAAFSVMLALVIDIGPGEFDQAHELKVAVKHTETAKDALRFVGGVQASGETFPGEGLNMPVVLDFRQLAVPEFGAYDVHTEIDGNVGPTITCYVVKTPA